MNVNQYKGFARWMVYSLFRGVIRKHKEFRSLMDHEFWLAFLVWFLLTALMIIPTALTAIYFLDPASGHIRTVMQVYMGLAITYFVGTGLGLAYSNYCEEQEQLLRELARRG